MNVQEFANLIGIKLFRPGTFYPAKGGTDHGVTYSEKDIDTMIRDSNAAHSLIQESIDKGFYPGNDNPSLTAQPIPAVMNLGHQKLLTEKMKEWARKVTAKFRKAGEWVVADLFNVDAELAAFVKELTPGRSVEIIPELIDPNTGGIFRNVIRSIAFLPKDTRPAVPELTNPDFAIQYEDGTQAKGGVLTVFTAFEENEIDEREQQLEQHEVHEMADEVTKKPTPQEENKKVETPKNVEESPTVSLAEFEALKAENEAEKRERENLSQKLLLMEKAIEKERQTSQRKDIEAYCEKMQAKGYKPALFDAEFKEAALALKRQNTILHFAEGKELAADEYWLKKFESILEDQAVKVPLAEEAGDAVGKGVMSFVEKQNADIHEIMNRDKCEWDEAAAKSVEEHPNLW